MELASGSNGGRSPRHGRAQHTQTTQTYTPGRSSASRGQVSYGHRAKSDRDQARAWDRMGGVVRIVGNRFRTTAPLQRRGPGSGVPVRAGEWLEWRQVAQTWQSTTHTNDTNLHAWAIAVRSLQSTCGGPGGLCVPNGGLRGLWATLSPTHEAWSGVAVLPEVRYHVDIVRKVPGTRRELGIAWEVSCESSETVSVQ